MSELKKDTFWDTDLKDLPGALDINDKTIITDSVGGIPTGCEYTQKETGKGVDNILEKNK